MESHSGRCMSCGGPVDDAGMYADGGEVPMEDEAPEGVVNDDGESTQEIQSEEDARNARRAFVRAVRSR